VGQRGDRSLGDLRVIGEAEVPKSIIPLGDSGTGKIHVAIAPAVLACQQGRRVRFTTLVALANKLQEAESRRELSRVVAR
jgi:DNA replication protein DnaC